MPARRLKSGRFSDNRGAKSTRQCPRHNSTATVRNRGPQGFDDDLVKDGHSFADERGFQIHLQRMMAEGRRIAACEQTP